MNVAPLSRFIILAVVVIIASVNPALSITTKMPGGFSLGSTLEEAKLHAEDNGWSLKKLEPLENSWAVSNTPINLIFNGGYLVGIEETLGGGFEEFIKLTSKLQAYYGVSKVQSVQAASQWYQIEMQFITDDRLKIKVILYSRDHKMKLYQLISRQ